MTVTSDLPLPISVHVVFCPCISVAYLKYVSGGLVVVLVVVLSKELR